MGRPRAFDEQTALDSATDCFWRYGFEGASTRMLTERMGITAASLYNAFGDKRTLYRRVLDRYADQALGWCSAALDVGQPLDAIEAVFNALAEQGIEDLYRRGCLVVNTGLETAPHDPAFQGVVVAVFERLEALFEAGVAKGQAMGVISRAQPSEDFARLLLGAMLGIRVLARTNPDPALLKGLARAAVETLRPAAGPSPLDLGTEHIGEALEGHSRQVDRLALHRASHEPRPRE
jgi:TetR/AcrR family transcriptional regulator, transcriptional repressor for nem operon